MSAPTAPAGAPPGPPPLPAARRHAIVALSVIASVGLFGAALAWLSASTAASGCDTYWALYAPGRNAYCEPAYFGLVVWSTPVGVALACGLAVVGVVRASHRWAVAAWAAYAVFCALWWAVYLTAG